MGEVKEAAPSSSGLQREGGGRGPSPDSAGKGDGTLGSRVSFSEEGAAVFTTDVDAEMGGSGLKRARSPGGGVGPSESPLTLHTK